MLPREDFIDLLIRCFFLFLGCVVLFIFIKFLPPLFQKRIRNIKYQGMTIDDLDTMKEKGLISEEESKKIKQSLAKTLMSDKKEPDKSPSPPAIPQAYKTTREEDDVAGHASKPSGVPPPHPIVSSDPEMRKYEELYRTGKISQKEYEKIADALQHRKKD